MLRVAKYISSVHYSARFLKLACALPSITDVFIFFSIGLFVSGAQYLFQSDADNVRTHSILDGVVLSNDERTVLSNEQTSLYVSYYLMKFQS
ncbi:hypothetical protein BX592_10413 [Paraburkholderia rhizosphaerae]|uniref:Uncharacterized protein n=1 Tax=Paraburkholderia rhizosphaerae TaxID=480658 RepID=A0A4R8LXC5_9BURK|nr:hypothetical protein BX592_10413 [Paraburkholderia rhizosphaerae]